MKSTFFYKEHPRHSLDQEISIEADYVTFEVGFVVFHERENFTFPDLKITRPSRIIRAEQADTVHGLREVLNDDE